MKCYTSYVTSNQTKTRKRWEPPNQYFWHPESPIDLVVLDGVTHLLACWTAPVAGKREVVAIELVPMPPDGPMGLMGEDPDQWFSQRLAAVQQAELHPIPAPFRRAVPLREVFAAREQFAPIREQVVSDPEIWDRDPQELQEALPAHGVEIPEDLEHVLTNERLLGYCFDAVLYVKALEDGRSPREVIAEARIISPRSAEARVAKARDLGFLTPARGRTASGELTELGRRVLAIVAPLLSKGDGNG
jgi:hypothetical protein